MARIAQDLEHAEAELQWRVDEIGTGLCQLPAP
jgi:hypothetical protein